VSVDGGSTATYAYDQSNQRYKKVTGGVTTHYIWQGSQVIAEHNGSTGTSTVDYVYSGSRMIAKAAGLTTQYFLSDRLSERLMLNTSGSVTGRQGHLPFGEDFAESGSQGKHHFTNYERDTESATDYAVNRQYSQSVGRFMRVDPYGGSNDVYRPQSLNRFAYVQGNPINATDPKGLNLAWDCWVTIDGGNGEPLYWTTHCRGYNDPTSGATGESGDGDPQDKTAPLPTNLRARLRKLLEKNNNECGNFVHALIAQVAGDTGQNAYSVDALDLFDAINAQGGYVLEQAVVNGQNVAGTVRGALANRISPATVVISPQTSAGAPFNVNAVQNSYTGTALHETIHLANSQGIYSDSQLATAAFNLGGLSDDLKDRYHNIKNEGDASKFWDGVLRQHCPQAGAFEQ
jgi:RHS repeat-associated protein